MHVEQIGSGNPLLLLHSEDYYEPRLPLIDTLAKKYKVIIPWMPGFGKSTLPDSIRNIDDMSYLYLDLMEKLKLKKTRIVGFSVGGWLANEIASKDSSRIDRMALVCPLGVKHGGPYDRDIEDIYFHTFERVKRFKFFKPDNDPRVLTEMSDSEAFELARARESTAKLCWEPYFHNPSLRYRLGRVTPKTLLIWGARDGIVKPAYGRKYARKLPNASFVSIPASAHFPHVEQPDAFEAELTKFLR